MALVRILCGPRAQSGGDSSFGWAALETIHGAYRKIYKFALDGFCFSSLQSRHARAKNH